MTDDGTALSGRIAGSLAAWGWSVVLLRFPSSLISERADRNLPDSLAVETLDSVQAKVVRTRLTEIERTYGPLGAFVHVHPSLESGSAADDPLDDRARALLKAVFVIATEIGPALNHAAAEGRSVFAAITQLDGEMGLGGGSAFDPVGGGLSGLVKTLHLEWPAVFCRVVDLDPAYEVEIAAARVEAELHDPNRRLVDIGWRAGRRVTLDALEEA